MLASCFHKGLAVFFPAHSSRMLHRDPVHKAYRPSRQSLPELIRRPAHIFRSGTGKRCPVSNTLEGDHRIIEPNTGSRKHSGVLRHCRKIINGQIRIGIQLIQSIIYGLDIFSSVAHDGLY